MTNSNCVTLDGNMYNIVHGVNEHAASFLSLLELSQSDLGRFRDCWLNEDGSKLIVFTRNGGGNREDYFPKNITKHPLYIEDYDDDYDNTYAHIVFKVPLEHLHITKQLATGRKPKTLKEKTEESLEKIEKTGEIPVALQKAVKQITDMLKLTK